MVLVISVLLFCSKFFSKKVAEKFGLNGKLVVILHSLCRWKNAAAELEEFIEILQPTRERTGK